MEDAKLVAEHLPQIIQAVKSQPPVIVVPALVEKLGLDPYQYRLWSHYWQLGAIRETLAETAAACCMSASKVWEVRQTLVSIGLISLQDKGNATTVVLTDLWAANAVWASSNTLLLAADWFKLYMQGQAPEPKKSVTRAKPKPTTNQDKLVGVRTMQKALLTVMGRDTNFAQNWMVVAPTARDLLTAGYAPEQITTLYGEGGWWYIADWRGQKGQKPSANNIVETIKNAVEGKVPLAANKRNETHTPPDINIQSSLLNNVPVGAD